MNPFRRFWQEFVVAHSLQVVKRFAPDPEIVPLPSPLQDDPEHPDAKFYEALGQARKEDLLAIQGLRRDLAAVEREAEFLRDSRWRYKSQAEELRIYCAAWKERNEALHHKIDRLMFERNGLAHYWTPEYQVRLMEASAVNAETKAVLDDILEETNAIRTL